jgi:hypothetical protein
LQTHGCIPVTWKAGEEDFLDQIAGETARDGNESLVGIDIGPNFVALRGEIPNQVVESLQFFDLQDYIFPYTLDLPVRRNIVGMQSV